MHHPKVEDALKYLEQVKIQFHDVPEVYDKFLEIMKDFKAQTIDTPGVIARVWELFKGHKDLILGFNTFLPPGYKIEVADLESGHAPTGLPRDRERERERAKKQQRPRRPPPRKPPTPPPRVMEPEMRKEFVNCFGFLRRVKAALEEEPDNFREFLVELRKYDQEETDIRELYDEALRLFENHQEVLNEFMDYVPEAAEAARAKQEAAALAAAKRAKRQSMREAREAKEAEQRASKRQAPDPAPAPRSPKRFKKGEWPDEVGFFNMVKRSMDEQEFQEFLKLLALYSQEVIDTAELVALASDLLAGEADLMMWLKSYVAYKGDTKKIETNRIRRDPVADGHRQLDYSQMKRIGPSFLELPPAQPLSVCSGRDDMCREVLNDTYVSVPASDTDDFIFKSSQKNEYEERLFRSDDDRFELDMVIEHNLSALRALEPLAARLTEMHLAGQTRLRIGDFLHVLQVKAIERVYGERAHEVLEGLRLNPHQAIPTIVRRLRQKDQEWRRVQREWNKTWGEVFEENYRKSLDHQSVSFKTNDRKALVARAMLQDVREKASQQRGSRVKRPQYTCRYTDMEVLEDVQSLLLFASDRCAAVQIDDEDKPKVKSFITGFMRKVLEMPPASFSSATAVPVAGFDGGDHGGAPTDMLAEGFASPSEESGRAETFPARTFVRVPQLMRRHATTPAPMDHGLFANEHFYLLFRLHAILYERLAKAKDMAASAHPSTDFLQRNQKVNPVAALVHPRQDDPDDAIALLEQLESQETTDTKSVSGEDGDSGPRLYRRFITLLKALIGGDVELARFEDTLRDVFGTSAYTLFTLDRVLSNMLKTLNYIVVDEPCERLLMLYDYERTRGRWSDALYRSQAMELLETTSIYRIKLTREGGERRVSLMLFEGDHEGHESEMANAREWSEYVERYVQRPQVDERMDARQHHIFLRRNQRRVAGAEPDRLKSVSILNGLSCKIDVRTGRIVFKEFTEDFVCSNRTRAAPAANPARRGKFRAVMAAWEKSNVVVVPPPKAPTPPPVVTAPPAQTTRKTAKKRR